MIDTTVLQPCSAHIESMSMLVAGGSEGRVGRTGRGHGKGNVGIFGGSMNKNAFG
jgi:hypothetical protein